jgi:Protein of unknown function (DUF3040)
MMDSDTIIQRAEEALRRHGSEPRLAKRLRQRRRQSFFGRIKRVIGVGAVLALGLILWGLIIGPVGTSGLMIAVLAFVIALVALMAFPKTPFNAAEPEPTTELALLPLQTEEWLAGQRKMLPAPAVKLVDGIGLTLEQLAPQLQRLDEKEPLAAEARRLIADELPELVKSYSMVPSAMRKAGMNGLSPDKQLVDGLAVVSSELSRLTEKLAQDDVNKLATQGRYLELKYQSE